MTWSGAADLAGALLLLLGALLCLAAAVGLLRFPDVLSRMHAATKPQTLGLILLVCGLALSLRELRVMGLLFLVVVLQLLTAPVAAHMVGRTAYRTHQVDDDALVTDQLADDLARAGFRLAGDELQPVDRDGEPAEAEDGPD
jgi:multicomponent Na+:H+ antiporter subunit G